MQGGNSTLQFWWNQDAKIVKTDVTVLPKMQRVRSVLALKSWKGNVAEVKKGSAHGSQSEAGIGNVSHHGHTH